LAGIALKIDKRVLDERLKRLGVNVTPRKYLKLVGEAWRGEIDRTFKREGRRGEQWKPLDPKTIKRRRKGSSRILQDTGTLRGSFSQATAQRSVRVGTNVFYAEYHEEGTTSKLGNPHIPKRQMIPTEETALDIADKIGKAWVRKKLARDFNKP
jgi:phage gpG-like protein